MNHHNSSFETLYLAIREKENRLLSDEKVKLLPYLPDSNHHFNEWKLRAKSAERFLNYLRKDYANATLLEVGCGNGWFANLCSSAVKKTIGIDVNSLEINQAKKVFKKDNLDFFYWNLYTETIFDENFDLIVLNASVQYFENFDKLISRLQTLLTPNGEIHIMDSPFYNVSEIKAAKKRSYDYYDGLGVSELSSFYHHHSLASISNFDSMYKPNNKILNKAFGKKDSPFSWYRLKT